jgi:hypothetical protein
MGISLAFEKYPKEGAIVGRLLTGYGEIEFDLMMCLSEFLGDINIAIRVIYRVRSESSRIDVADAMLRPHYASFGLSKEYEEAFIALQFCKKLRNNYAHSHWSGIDTGLFYTSFEKPAETTEGTGAMKFSHLTEQLLQQQETFFGYCQQMLIYLCEENRLRSGKTKVNRVVRPKLLQPPPLCTPQEKAPPFEMNAKSPSQPKETPP